MLDKATYKSDWEAKLIWYEENGYLDQLITSEDHPGGLGGMLYADEVREHAKQIIEK